MPTAEITNALIAARTERMRALTAADRAAAIAAAPNVIGAARFQQHADRAALAEAYRRLRGAAPVVIADEVDRYGAPLEPAP